MKPILFYTCTSSHGQKPWRSRLNWKEVAGPALANSTVAVFPLTVTPSLIRCTVHIAEFAVEEKHIICTGTKTVLSVGSFVLRMCGENDVTLVHSTSLAGTPVPYAWTINKPHLPWKYGRSCTNNAQIIDKLRTSLWRPIHIAIEMLYTATHCVGVVDTTTCVRTLCNAQVLHSSPFYLATYIHATVLGLSLALYQVSRSAS